MTLKEKYLIQNVNNSINKAGVAKISWKYIANLFYPNAKNNNNLASKRRMHKIISRLSEENKLITIRNEKMIEFMKK